MSLHCIHFSKKNKNSFSIEKCNERYVVYILPASNVTGMDNIFFFKFVTASFCSFDVAGVRIMCPQKQYYAFLFDDKILFSHS